MTAMRITASALALAVFAELTLIEAGQLPPRDTAAPAASAGTARISGTVVATETGAALRNTLIQISGGSGEADQRFAWIDGEGRYEMGGLAAGRYTLRAEKTGYVTPHGRGARP